MYKSKIQALCLFILSGFPLLGMRGAVWSIMLFVLVSLITGDYRRLKGKPFTILILSGSLFALIALRCVFPNYNSNSLSYLEVSLSLLFLPLSFYLLRDAFTEVDMYRASWTFILSTLISFSFGITYSLVQVSQMGLENQDVISFHIRTFFENALHYHPTYASVILGMVILMLVDKLIKNHGNRILLSTLLLVATLILVLLASRTPIASTILCVALLVALRTRNVKMTLLTSFSIALASIVFFLTVPSFSARFKEVSINNTKLPDKKSEDSFNLRTGIFKCGTGIVKENWLLGIGPGNISAELNACYDSIAPDVYKDKNFNTHNQFIDYWAGLGVLGPLLLIALLGICAFSFWQTKNWIGLCTVLLFTGAMQTENLLVRQNGIVAFCYFIGIHIFALANSSEPNRGPKAEH